MTNQFVFTLENGSKKHTCPNCNKKTYVRYVNSLTGDYLPEKYGRCDRESKCLYHINPYRDGYLKNLKRSDLGKHPNPRKQGFSGDKRQQLSKPEPTKPKFIPGEILKQTLKGYEQNIFVQNMLSEVSFPFEVKDVERVIALYHLGTVNQGHRTGCITFPFIDINGNIRAIQVKQFDKSNHTIGTDFLHSIIERNYKESDQPIPGWLMEYNSNESKVTSLFGEQLLNKYPLNPIALVEAPKTAIYGTLYFGFPNHPKNLLWLAVYNLSSLKYEKCKVLCGRDVYLFPDLSRDGKAFHDWSNKARQFSELMPGTRFKVSDLLEKFAPKELREKGADIADVLIKMNWRKFRPVENPVEPKGTHERSDLIPVPISEKGEKSEASNKPFLSDAVIPRKWTPQTYKTVSAKKWDISQLEQFFNKYPLPDKPIMLAHSEMITNIPLFVEGHLTVVKANNGNRTFLPFFNRLELLKEHLIINKLI
jgi:hypothetical protein